MSNELIFKDRHAYGLAAGPALVALVAALFIFDEGDFISRTLIALTAGGLAGVVVLAGFSLFASLTAWYQLYRGKGYSRLTVVSMIFAALTVGVTAWFVAFAVSTGITNAVHWLFDGSRFMAILTIMWVCFILVVAPYNAYKDRKVRNKLNVINITPSGRTDLIKK